MYIQYWNLVQNLYFYNVFFLFKKKENALIFVDDIASLNISYFHFLIVLTNHWFVLIPSDGLCIQDWALDRGAQGQNMLNTWTTWINSFFRSLHMHILSKDSGVTFKGAECINSPVQTSRAEHSGLVTNTTVQKNLWKLCILLSCQPVLVGQSSHSEDKVWSLCGCFQYARVEGRNQVVPKAVLLGWV